MFEDEMLKAKVARFFDNLELQFFNLLQLNKRNHNLGDTRELAGYLVNFCEGQFLRLVRSNFRYNQFQQFDKQWLFIKPLFEGKIE